MTLVSAIMPTRGRQKWAEQALWCFLNQKYPNKELIIVDDAEDPSFPDWTPVEGVLRVVMETHHNIPTLRNVAARIARGDILMHFDSDDWSVPERMADQVTRLEQSGKSATGYSQILFYEDHSGIWGKHVLDSYEAFGTSLCYYRAWWADHPFLEGLDIGEDNDFVRTANSYGQMTSTIGLGMMVARAHQGNTSPKDMGNCRTIDPSIIPSGFPQ